MNIGVLLFCSLSLLTFLGDVIRLFFDGGNGNIIKASMRKP